MVRMLNVDLPENFARTPLGLRLVEAARTSDPGAYVRQEFAITDKGVRDLLNRMQDLSPDAQAESVA
jgi:hypothetical protein